VFCPRCGYNNVDTANFCGGCALALSRPASGASPPSYAPPPGPPPGPPPPFAPPGPPPGAYGGPPVVAPHWSGTAIAGFCLSFFCGILGLIFSIMGHRECKASNGAVQGEGLAIAGIVISILNIIIGGIRVARL
jgi:hypothetical protein